MVYWIYLFMFIVVSSLSMAQQFKKKEEDIDGEVLVGVVFTSLLIGAIWILSVWVALILWYVDEETPYWTTVLINIKRYFIKK